MTSLPPPEAGHDPGDPGPVGTGWATATGPRPDNQDRVAVGSRWAVVGDGVGGQEGGAVAAELAVEAAAGVLASAPFVDARVVEQAMAAANAAVRERRSADPALSAMATTLILAGARAVAPDHSSWTVAGVGDSPAWLAAGGRLTRVSEEDNVAAVLVRAGAISPEEARDHPGRHMITQAVGSDRHLVFEPVAVTLAPGDTLVLASDGIEVLDDAAILSVVSAAATASAVANRLVEAALAAGTTDNVTVAVVRHHPMPPTGAAR